MAMRSAIVSSTPSALRKWGEGRILQCFVDGEDTPSTFSLERGRYHKATLVIRRTAYIKRWGQDVVDKRTLIYHWKADQVTFCDNVAFFRTLPTPWNSSPDGNMHEEVHNVLIHRKPPPSNRIPPNPFS